ncbi:MAG TPA: serine hydrolase domain-containing protein [Terriglobales bacterium]|jgi:CubicO group peptidase (beta-lactamase class C family)|nr:serine hydrolase domain-containing protein [Terriglobales bacterium]
MSSSAIKSIVDSAAAEFLKNDPQAVGVSIGVLTEGSSYTYNYGSEDKGAKTAPAADNLYPIASITKTFTGTLLAQAATEKRLSLKDDVRKYLAEPYPNLEYQGYPILVEQLVNHLSGLPFNLPDIPENRPPFPPASPAAQQQINNYTRANFLADLHKVKLGRVPGEKFSYSNTAAVLASLILERMYGKHYEDIVKEKIATPLQMTNTTISLSSSQEQRLMKGYDEKGNEIPYGQELALGAGGLKSTVADLLKYAQWHMDEADPVVKISHQPTFTYNNYSVGLNWQMVNAGGYRRIWQEGDRPGFTSICMVIPELKIGIVILANEEDQKSSHALTLMANRIVKELDARSAPLF